MVAQKSAGRRVLLVAPVLARRVLRANNDARPVTADIHARYFGAELDEHSLTPGSNARIAPTRFEDWLNRSTAMQPTP